MRFYRNSTHYEELGALNGNTDNGTLPIPKSSILIPCVMFFLGVVGNSLGIASLLMYRWRSVRCEVPTNTSVIQIKAHSFAPEGAEPNNGEGQLRRHSSASIGKKNNLEVRHSPVQITKSRRQRKRLKFGPFHTLVLGLLSVDLLGNLFTSPVTLILYANNVTIKAATGTDHLCNYSAFAMMFLGIVTMSTLMAMAVERVMSIRHAYFYHRHVTSRKAAVVLFMILVISALFTSLPSVGFGKIRPMFPYTWCFADWNAVNVEDKLFNYTYAIIGALLIVGTVVCNFRVVAGLIEMKKRIKTTRQRHIRYETQMIIQLIVMTCVYLICWLPLVVRIIANQASMLKQPQHDRIAIWLASANPILDPWVYILFRRSVIKRLSAVFKAILCIPKYQKSMTSVRKINIVPAEESRISRDHCNYVPELSASLPLNCKNARFSYGDIEHSDERKSSSVNIL